MKSFADNSAGSRWLITVALLLLSPVALAKTSDFEQAVDVNADRSRFDERAGTQVLEGNVVITQGTIRIEAQSITVKLADNKLASIEGTGNPIVFQQENDQGELVTGRCSSILYEAARGRLTLSGNATLSEPGQQLSSDRIVFDSRSQTVIAERGETGRVSITIQPPEPDNAESAN